MKRRIGYLLLLFFLLSGRVNQDVLTKPRLEGDLLTFYNLANRGFELSYKGSFDSASNHFYKAFRTYAGYPDYLNVFISTELKCSSPDPDRLKLYFETSAVDFGAIQNYFFTDSIYSNAMPEEVQAYVNLNKDKWQQKFQSGIDLDKLLILNRLTGPDQFVRDRNQLKPKIDSTEIPYFIRNEDLVRYQKALMRETDAKAREYVLELLENDQFPRQKGELGVNGFYAFILLVHHCFYTVENDSLLAVYEGYFTDAFNKGLMSNWQYATTIDYVFSYDKTEQKKKLRYGFNPRPYEALFRQRNMAILDVWNLDKRRQEIGLLPLWKEAQLRGKYDQLPKSYLESLRE